MKRKSNTLKVIDFQPVVLVEPSPRYYTIAIATVLVHLLILYMTHS